MHAAAAEPVAAEASPVGVRWSSRDLWIVAAISAAAALVRLWRIEQWSWSAAEAETWCALTQPLSAADGFAGSGRGLYPLVYLAERALLSLGLLPGYGEGWLRLPSAFSGAIMVPCVAVLARRPFGRVTALLSALALAFHPTHIAVSQTADPLLAGVAIALLAGAASQRLPFRLVGGLVVLAGLCHPVGWVLGGGLVLVMARPGSRAARLRDRLAGLPRWGWWCGAALLLPWGGESWLSLRGPVVVLALAACCVLPGARGPGALLGVLGGLVGIFAWWSPGASSAALLAALPLAVMLAAAMAVHLFGLLAQGFEGPRWLGRALAASAALVLVGELMTGAFLYFVVQRGGRPPWRELQRTLLASARPGAGLHVLAGRGAPALLVYLRPNHWRGDDYDPHPGTSVEVLADDGRRAAQLEQPDVALALEQPELDALRADPALAPALAAFREHDVFPCPQPGGDRSLHLLRRRPPE